jgi:hypothetical protein
VRFVEGQPKPRGNAIEAVLFYRDAVAMNVCPLFPGQELVSIPALDRRASQDGMIGGGRSMSPAPSSHAGAKISTHASLGRLRSQNWLDWQCPEDSQYFAACLFIPLVSNRVCRERSPSVDPSLGSRLSFHSSHTDRLDGGDAMSSRAPANSR